MVEKGTMFVALFVGTWLLGLVACWLIALIHTYREQEREWGDGFSPSGKPWRLIRQLSNGRRLYTDDHGSRFVITFNSIDGWGKEK